MKHWIPLLLIGLLAACAPGPQEPAMLEPVAPMTETPDTTIPETTVPEVAVPDTTPSDTAAPDTAVSDATAETEDAPPEEPTITVIPSSPEGEDAADEGGEAGNAEAGNTNAGAAAPAGNTSSGGVALADPEDPGIPATIGISADNATFVSAGEGERNSITLAAGSTFYLRIQATDPEGITGAAVELRNSEAEGTLPTGPFSVASSDCETQTASAPTELTCTVTVTIAPDAQNIQEEGEAAYAFRPRITDAAGNSELAYSWGYLIIQ